MKSVLLVGDRMKATHNVLGTQGKQCLQRHKSYSTRHKSETDLNCSSRKILWLVMNKRLVQHWWEFHHKIQSSHINIQMHNSRIDQLP
jgi:hypothetical protein